MASTTTTSAAPQTYKLQLMSGKGPVYRDVLCTEPRDCDLSEVPIIDISGIYGSEDDQKELAKVIRAAAENTGFFYIKNHGLPAETIEAAYKQTKRFFSQTTEQKRLVSMKQSKFFNGWSEPRSGQISPTESRDNREGFSFRYDPQYDPDTKDLNAIPDEVKPWLRGEEFVWDKTSHLPGFKDDMLAYWRACLTLSRRMIRVFAMALDLPKTYFDDIVTYPGSDTVLNYYPKNTTSETSIDVGIGAHSDLQCFTLLWQDTIGGLQVLTREGQWIKVPPVQGTYVVNIGDFLMRLSNDRFQSTVHRVFNYAQEDRHSMPFFFGFNFNEKCAVLPTCKDENNPAKYEPISCGDWCRIRIAQTYAK